MATAALPIASSMPAEYNIDEPQTASAFVLRRNYVELLPNEQIVFQPQSGQDMIRFIVNDPSSFWMAANSYWRFMFKAGDSAMAPVANLRLGSAGMDSLFRMIEVRAVASGTSLIRQNFYHHGVAAQQYFFRPDEYSVGDGFDLRDRKYKQPRVPDNYIRIPKGGADHTIAQGTPSTSSVTADQQVVLTLNVVNAIGVINIDDIVSFDYDSFRLDGLTKSNVGVSSPVFVGSAQDHTTTDLNTSTQVWMRESRRYKMRVTAVSVDTSGIATSTVTGDLIEGQDINTTASGTAIIRNVSVLQRKIHKTQSSYICDGKWHTVCWSPMNSFFWQIWPLYLLKGGLEIILYLENPNISLVQDINPNVAQTQLGYQIQSPRLVALMSTPEPSIQRDFIGKWNSDQGLVYYCPQLETRKMQGNATDTNMVLNVPFGKRSLRNVMFSIIPANIANGSGALGVVHDAFRSNIRSHLRYFWVQVAANYFPARRIEVDDEANEILWQTKNALSQGFAMNNNMDMEKYQHKRFENEHCYYWTSASGVHFAASGGLAYKKFETRDRVYIVQFSRTDGKGGILSGIDGSIASVDLQIDRNGYSYASAYVADESRDGDTNDLADTGEAQWADTPVYMVHGYFDHFIDLAARGILVLN